MEIRNILNNNAISVNESNSTDKITPVKEEKVKKENIEIKDTIELSADENLINTRKAFDALNEASREMAKDKDDNIAYSAQFLLMMHCMKHEGIEVPDFTDKNDKSFIDFVDKMKSFVIENTASGSLRMQGETSDFLDFCDLYKQKLIEAGCK